MKNTRQKLKVQQATSEEVQAILEKTLDKFDKATVGELQSSLCSLAESFIEVTAACPDQLTKYGLAMELVCQTLDAHIGTVGLQETIEVIEPPTGSTN